MSNAAILYLRLLRKIVRESAWRLGGGEETFLAGGFGGGDGSVIHGRGDAVGTCGGTVRSQRARVTERDSNGSAQSLKPGVRRETSCGQGQTREPAEQTGEPAEHRQEQA